MLSKVVLAFVSVNKIIPVDSSNERYRVALSSSAIHYAVQRGSNFLNMWIKCVYYAAQGVLKLSGLDEILLCNIQQKALETYFPVMVFSCVYYTL